jgi:formate hydrogenlyase subunit 3/multisubunit Na+/H+ antiporter MnhD subunit
MSSEVLLLWAVGVIAASGFIGLLAPPGDSIQRIVVALFTVGALVGLAAALRVLALGGAGELRMAWNLPGAEFQLRIDRLSAWFLVPIFFISGLGAWYGLEYWRLADHPTNGRRLLFFYAMTTGAMALLVSARNGMLFLAAWEVMALSAFFLVTTEDEHEQVREAGWVYFVATHASTLLLISMFGLYWTAKGSFILEPLAPGAAAPSLENGIFLLALGGFGIKAGLFPVHVWLPPAHANAPSHVSALLSGVLIKMGVYGILRITWLFSNPPLWWGGLLLGLGVISGVLGVAFALGQHDMKRLLAYHSIENIGIIFIGLGMAVTGRAVGDTRLVALGIAGALLHTWNHGLFKTLLFFGAGAVLHRTHTREIDRLGGLAKSMPRTALFFVVGAAAICGLPPLNGFVSELFLYLGLFGTLVGDNPLRWLQGVIAIPALALIGTLAVACFVKIFGAVFLGEPRSDHARSAVECGPAMIVPMGVLAAACALIGLFPLAVAPVLDRTGMDWALQQTGLGIGDLAPLAALTVTGTALLAGCGAIALMLRSSPTGIPIGTWDCGYTAPSARIQYTSSSFAQLLVGLWGWVLLPQVLFKRLDTVFPAIAGYSTRVPDTVLDRGVIPFLRGAAWLLSWLRPLQRGNVNAYLFYVFLTLLILLSFR